MGLRLEGYSKGDKHPKSGDNEELDVGAGKAFKDDSKAIKEIVKAGYTRPEAVKMIAKSDEEKLQQMLKKIVKFNKEEKRRYDLQTGREVNKGGLIKKMNTGGEARPLTHAEVDRYAEIMKRLRAGGDEARTVSKKDREFVKQLDDRNDKANVEPMRDGGKVRKKKKTAKNMMSGGKVYSRGSRRAKYNG